MKAFLRTIDIALCCAVLAGGTLSVCAQAPAGPAVHWQGNVEAAQRLAGQSNRLVLMHFWAPWCKPCMRLDSEVFSQPQFGPALEANYVPVKLNADDSRAIARQYGITQLPVDVIITPAGKLVTILPSPPSAEKYIAQLNEVAAGHRQVAAGANPQAAPGAPAGAAPAAPPAAPATPAAYVPPQGPAAPATPVGDRYADFYNQGGQAGAAAGSAAYGAVAAGATAPATAPGYPAQQPPAGGYYGPESAAPAGPPPGNPAYGAPPPGQQPPGATGGYAQQPPAQQNPTQAYAAQQYQPQPGQQYPPQQNPAQQYPPQQAPAQQYPSQPYAGQPYPAQPNPGQVPGAAPPPGAYGPANPAAQPPMPPVAQQLPPGSPPLGMDGYCPVTLVMQKKWVAGDKRFGAIHRGRTYLFAGEDEQKRFLANPDSFSPVMSGIDPVLALDQNQTIAGTRKYGVFMGGRIYLFSSQESMSQFEKNPKRYAAEVLQARR